jgi:membrane associated rhomboid family serine protease
MESRYDQLSPIPPLTRVTKALIITCVVTYLVDFVLSNLGFNIGGYSLRSILGLVPALVTTKFWLWQFVTYIFMHGHPLHILLNMLILWYFGAEIELRMGAAEFLRYFLLCGVGGGVVNFLVVSMFTDPSHLTNPIIGASGAIFGILAAYGIFFANRYFLVFFLFPMKAKYFVLVMAAIELITGVEARPEDNVAHFAHIGGMFIGAVYIYFRYVRPTQMKGGSRKDHERERLKKQFTLIVNESNPNKDEKGDNGGPYWN